MELKFRNPVFSAPDNSRIDCEVLHKKYGWVPFTASPNDHEWNGRDVYQRAQPTAAPYEAPPQPTEQREELPRWAFMAVVEGEVGLVSQIDTALAAMPAGTEKTRALAKWNYAISFRYDAPELVALKTAIGMTDETFNALWLQAEALLG